MLVHRLGCLASVAHGEDHGGTAAYDVAAGVDHLIGALHGLLVHHDGAPARDLQSAEALRYERVGGDPHADDHLIHLQPDGVTFNRHGTAAARLVGSTQLHALQQHALYPSPLITIVTKRVVEGVEVDTLLLGMLHLLDAGGH